MGTHPIENIMQTTMESIRNMVDVNTIVGDTVVMGDGTVIIPISKVSFGFVAGGGEYAGRDGGGQQGGGGRQQEQPAPRGEYPFAGGTGAGVSVSPMAFLVVSEGDVQLLPVQFNNSYERMLEKIPDLLCELKHVFAGNHDDEHGHKERESRKDKDKDEEKPRHRWRHGDDEQDAGAQDSNARPAKDEL